MNALTADESLATRLAEVKEEVEIRSVAGASIGVFTPRALAEQKRRNEEAWKLFDLEEIAEIARTEKGQYSTEEVLQYLHSLEAKG
jgi:hypothetical protein